jgi:hypothetical protein
MLLGFYAGNWSNRTAIAIPQWRVMVLPGAVVFIASIRRIQWRFSYVGACQV